MYFVVAESVFNEGEFLTLIAYRKNKRTLYKFSVIESNTVPAIFWNEKVAKNYGDRLSFKLSPEVVDREAFENIKDHCVKRSRDMELDESIHPMSEENFSGWF
jgi:hypothetical protein